MNVFVTGSHAYGEPNADSDIDLVVLVDGPDLSRLRQVADEAVPKDYNYGTRTPGGWSLRFGKLNLLCVRDDAQVAAWRYGTEKLRQQKFATGKPVTRETAVSLFRSLRDALRQEPTDVIATAVETSKLPPYQAGL